MNRISLKLSSNYITFLICALVCMAFYGALDLLPQTPLSAAGQEFFAIFKVAILTVIFICFCLGFYGLLVKKSAENRN